MKASLLESTAGRSVAHGRGQRIAGGTRGLRKGAVAAANRIASALGVWPRLRTLLPGSLNVLLYHRIADPADPAFFGLTSNVSATPAMFASELDHLVRHYQVIDIETFLAWVRGEKQLPPRAVLITFDDGYRDNLLAAVPELERRGLPAVLFLTTDYVADARPFFWDVIAEAFRRTARTSGELPLLGHCAWGQDCNARDRLADELCGHAIGLSQADVAAVVSALTEVLAVEHIERPPPGTHVDWDDVRELERRGVAVCPHTRSHIALKALDAPEIEAEIAGSAAAIAAETGLRRPLFAYPYGRPTDFTPASAAVLRRLGFVAAFRSNGGTILPADVGASPYALRRSAVFLRHDAAQFAGHAAGISRLTAR